jgi:hypothetical protein
MFLVSIPKLEAATSYEMFVSTYKTSLYLKQSITIRLC